MQHRIRDPDHINKRFSCLRARFLQTLVASHLPPRILLTRVISSSVVEKHRNCARFLRNDDEFVLTDSFSFSPLRSIRLASIVACKRWYPPFYRANHVFINGVILFFATFQPFHQVDFRFCKRQRKCHIRGKYGSFNFSAVR